MPTLKSLKKKNNSYTSTSYRTRKGRELYNTPEWKDLRESYNRNNPLCEDCLLKGRITPAQHTHHIQPFMNGSSKSEQLTLLLDWSNLRSLCIDCHKEAHKRLRNG